MPCMRKISMAPKEVSPTHALACRFQGLRKENGSAILVALGPCYTCARSRECYSNHRYRHQKPRFPMRLIRCSTSKPRSWPVRTSSLSSSNTFSPPRKGPLNPGFDHYNITGALRPHPTGLSSSVPRSDPTAPVHEGHSSDIPRS
jgi:hypothetical protein